MKDKSYRRVPKTPAYLFFIIKAIFFTILLSSQKCPAADSSPWAGNDIIYSTISSGSAGDDASHYRGQGEISGRIFAQDSQIGLPNIVVKAKLADSFVVEAYDLLSGELQGSSPVSILNSKTYQTSSDAEGVYSLRHLPAGTYKIWVEPKNSVYAGFYYPSALTLTTALPVDLPHEAAVSGLDFFLKPGGLIKGAVSKRMDGAPLADITINAYHYGNELVVTSTKTNADGTYSLPGLPTGKYAVKAEKMPEFVDAYYGGTNEASSALPVSADNGEITADIDITLRSYGAISGLIRDQAGKPLAGARVMAYDFDAPQTPYLRPLSQTASGPDGTYKLQELLVGRLRLVADPLNTYVSQIYDHQNSSATAAAVNLEEGGQLTNINFNLAVGGTIQGMITAQTTGLPIASVKLEAIDLKTGNISGTVFSNPQGKYSLDKLPSGSYLIGASAANYTSGYFPGVLEQTSAVAIDSSAGMIRGNIDFQLSGTPVDHVGTISGKLVRAADGSAISNGCINAFNILTNRLDAFDCSNPNGDFLIEGLADGDYRLCSRAGSGYINQCFANIKLEDSSNSTPVKIADGKGVDQVNFSLVKMGTISGTISRADKFTEDDDDRPTNIGTYEITNLPPGQYLIRLITTGTGYLGQYYPESLTRGSAAALTVNDGQTRSAVDFTLTVGHNPNLAAISGRVSRSDGFGLGFLKVNALNPDNNEVVKTTFSGADGQYLLADLDPGIYLVQVETSGIDYLPVYYFEADNTATATEISLEPGHQQTAINFQMTTGASIKGRVYHTDHPAEGVRDIQVCATLSGQTGGKCRQSDQNGYYDIPGLTPGKYAIYAEPRGTTFHKILAKEYFNEKESYTQADLIKASEGQTVSGVDLGLNRLASISGTITDRESGNAIGGLRVVLIDAQSKKILPSLFAETAINGSYTIQAVPTGSYLVQALAGKTLYRGQYYQGTLNRDEGESISVKGGQAVTHIDFALSAGGAISGTVSRADNGQPLPGLLVHILDYETGRGVVAGRTIADGSYFIQALASGSYKAEIPADQTVFQGEFFSNAAEISSAAKIEVEAGKETANINFNLEVINQ